MSLIEKLLDGNKKYLNKIKDDKNLSLKLDSLSKNGQHPYALVITCSDSRVVPEYIFDTSIGDLFVIRTAGNVVNEGELASISYGMEHLHIKCVIVLGHTKCGAVGAYIHNEQGKYLDPILKRLKSSINEEKDELKATRMNALAQVKYIKEKFPNYDGDVCAMIYDITSGKVELIKE